MDCIPYINDLQIEIQMLRELKNSGNCDVTQLEQKILEKEELIERCKSNLEKLSDNQICYRIYLKILNGMTPSKAVEEVSEENYLNNTGITSLTVLWTKYYKKMKEILKNEVKTK